jgi:beta-lactamase class A
MIGNGHISHARRVPAALAPGLALCLLMAAMMVALIGTASAQPARAQALAPASAAAATKAQPAICTAATSRYRARAARMSRSIASALHGRSSIVGLAAADTRTGISCNLHSGWHFHSASIVKVIILGTLLHDLGVRHHYLTPEQVTLTTEMITESDNAAATALWDEDGMRNLRHFLHLARMVHTTLGQDGYWGLTRVTAHDEMLLLNLLTTKNSVLDRPSRAYALKLMADVIPSQRWGVPAGAPAGVTVHVKNGWLPDPDLWVINSIGAFTSHDRVYRIVVLTRDNPSMDYGVDTVQGVAEVINRDLNPGQKPAVLPSAPFSSWGTADEQIPR